MQPEINNSQSDAKLPWYRSSIVWLGIIITLVVLAGCIHFVVVTRDLVLQSPNTAAPVKKELTTILGVPMSSSPAENNSNEPVSPKE